MYRYKMFFEKYKKNIRKILIFYCIVCILGVLLITVFRYGAEEKEKSYIELNTAEKIFVDGVAEAVSIRLPYYVKDKASKGIDIYIRIPENEYRVPAISFVANHKNIWIYHNGSLIYDRVYKNPIKGQNSGSGNVFCPLVGAKAGDYLRIKLERINDINLNSVGEMYLKSALLTEKSYMSENSILFTISLGLFMAGVLMLIVALIYTRFGARITSIIYIAAFSIASSTWILCNSKMAQVLTSNWELIYVAEYIGLYSIPLLLWGFLNSNWKKQSQLAEFTMTLDLIFLAISLTTRLLGVFDFYDFLLGYQSLSLLNILSLIYIMKSKVYGECISLKLFYLSCILLASTGIIAIFIFYKTPNYDALQNHLIFGMVLMIFVMALGYMISSKKSIELLLEDKIYRELAYKDALTGLGNRAKFEKDLETFEQIKLELDNLIFVIADANYLKNINDTMGHLVGDMAIKTIATALKESFDNFEEIYRIGGDEFCIIIQNSSLELVQKRLEKVDEILLCTDMGFPISISYGFEQYNVNNHDSLMKLYKIADSKMYETKAFYRKMADI